MCRYDNFMIHDKDLYVIYLVCINLGVNFVGNLKEKI